AKTVFQRLLKEFPDSQFREDTLYDLGYIHFEEGNRKDGAELFRELVKNKPKSRYAPEVQFRLAEWDFESYRLADAEERYRAVLGFGNSEYTDKALFKLGWVYYNLDDYSAAKKDLGQLLDRQSAKIAKEGGEFAPPPILFFPGPRRAALERVMERKDKDLYEETLEIIARVYAESGGADALVSFLRTKQRGSTPPPYAPPLMHRLALVEKERANFEQASRAYQLLLDAFPTYRDAPKIENEWVKVLVEQKEMEKAARVREALLAKYDTGSKWARANPEQEIRDEAMKAARSGLAWSIRYFHSQGLEKQKAGEARPAELVHAIELYERYLKRFTEGKFAYQKRFRYAQTLFAAGEYLKAAEVFRAVAADPTIAEKREEAAFARILSVEKLTEANKPPFPKEVIDALVAAYEDYIALNPQSEKVAQLIFKEGQLYFGSEQYPQAIAAFERLIRERPGDPLAVEANDLVAQAHYRLGDFAIAEKYSERALTQASPSNPLGARRAEVENLFAVTMFKQGEKADEEKKYDEAREHYLRLVTRLPQNESAARALYNAAAATEKAGRQKEAVGLFEKLLAEYPATELAPDAAVRLAEAWKEDPQATARIIPIYERVSDFHVQDPKGEEFLFLAGKLAVKEKREGESLRLFEKFLTRYPSSNMDVRGQRNVEALYHVGVAYGEAGNMELARFNLEQFLNRALPANASFGEGPEAYTFAVAKAQLLLGNSLARQYQATRISAPTPAELKKKEAALDQVVARYAPAARSGLSPIATEASFGIGRSYEEFANALLEAPKPSGLTPEEREEYDRLMFQKVRPYLAKAVEAYRVSVKASREKGLDDDWVSRSRERLAAIGPRVFERNPRPGYIRLENDATPLPPLLDTYAGVRVAPKSAGFFGGMFANDEEKKKDAFAAGLAAANESDDDEAIDRFREAAADGPAEAGYNLAIVSARRGNSAAALSALDDVNKRFPTFHAATTLAARLHERGGHPDRAVNLYRSAASAEGATGGDKAAYALYLEKQGKTEDALAAFREAAAVDPESGDAALGVVRLSGAKTLEELGPVVRLLRSPAALVDFGIHAADRGVPIVAARAFEAATAGIPSSDGTKRAIVWNNMAAAAVENGELPIAESVLQKARQADPSLAALRNTTGMLLMRRGEFEAAEKELRAAVEADPKAGAPWANLGILQELYFGAPDEAVQSYNRYLATKPSDRELVAGWIREIREGASDRSKSI
ncbi:MAG: tetratricopeptide repeat protein, partial [Candidatus Binatia bacterium]